MGEAKNIYFTCLRTGRKMGKTKANKTGQDKAYLHPKSRKAKHLSSFQAHNDKAKKAQDLKLARLESKAAKMMFFKERMEEMFLEDEKLSRTQMLHVIEAYFARFVNEVDQISMIQSFPKRHGRQNAARQDAISMTISQVYVRHFAVQSDQPASRLIEKISNISNFIIIDQRSMKLDMRILSEVLN